MTQSERDRASSSMDRDRSTHDRDGPVSNTLIGRRLDRRVMSWLIAAVLVVEPLEAIGYDNPIVTATLPFRVAALIAMLVLLRRGHLGPVATGRLFLTQALVTLFGSSILVDADPARAAIEGIAYGTILPIFVVLIAPRRTRRRWSFAVAAVVIASSAFRLLPDQLTVFTQVVAVLVVHGAALAMLDVHTDRAEQAGEMAGVDPLTGLWNRRETLARLIHSIDLAAAGTCVATIVVLDLDHFKSVNDSLGHEAGDEVLRRVADVMTSLLRSGDTASRWGGEEFLVHLPATECSTASDLAERMRFAFAVTGTTASFGVAEVSGDDSATTWVGRADRAMYAAKEAGRNRVVTSP